VEGERSEISSLMGEIRSEFEEYQQDLQQASERAQTSIANLVQYVQSLTEDENLRRSLEAIRYRLMLDSEIGEERTQAINGLAFVGDQEDLVRLTGIRNNPEENGTVRLAADEAIRSIRERLNLPDDDES
ncbi:hypothetical protein KKB28_08305, partial [bacterium]|nr:hypothetical protein [bacterium]